VIEDKNEDNAIGNLVALLQGSDASSELKKIEDQLQSKKKIKEIELLLNEKRSKWDGLQKDLGKPEFESYTTEIGFTYEEINFALKKIKTDRKIESKISSS
jgi:aldehyde dehydrogenase (NAD+)